MKFKDLHVRVALFAVSILAMLWGYRLMVFDELPGFFTSVREDLSYGWYVPVFSLYVLWRERQELAASVGEPSWLGVALALPFLFLGFLGVRGCQVRMEIVGFVGLLIALALAFFGGRTMKRVLFPALFLLFCMPLHGFLAPLTIHLRMLAVSIACGTLEGCGVEIVRQGTMLGSASGSFVIDVADPCSGLRSLFAMMALTAGYAYFSQPTWLRRGLLLALAVPIVVAGNAVRILTIAVIAAVCSPDFATGFYHDYSGYIIFLAAIFLMVAVGGLITKGAERCERR